MSKISPVSWRELVYRLRKFDFTGPYAGGKHLYMLRDNLVLTIPNPHHQEIRVDLLVRILRQSGISREDWLRCK